MSTPDPLAAFLHRDTLKKLAKRLAAGELVEKAVQGKRDGKAGYLAATPKRILWIRERLIGGPRIEDVPMARVGTVGIVEEAGAATVVVRASGEQFRVVGVRVRSAEAFVHYTKAQVNPPIAEKDAVLEADPAGPVDNKETEVDRLVARGVMTPEEAAWAKKARRRD